MLTARRGCSGDAAGKHRHGKGTCRPLVVIPTSRRPCLENRPIIHIAGQKKRESSEEASIKALFGTPQPRLDSWLSSSQAAAWRAGPELSSDRPRRRSSFEWQSRRSTLLSATSDFRWTPLAWRPCCLRLRSAPAHARVCVRAVELAVISTQISAFALCDDGISARIRLSVVNYPPQRKAHHLSLPWRPASVSPPAPICCRSG